MAILEIVGEAVRHKGVFPLWKKTAILPGEGVAGKTLRGRPRETTSTIFPRHDMYNNKHRNENSVNEDASNNWMKDSRSAEETARHPRSSTSEGLAAKLGKKKEQLRIATWNVRMMNIAGKLENVTREMSRMSINVLGLCETRWTGEDDFLSDEYRIIQSGGDEKQRRVALILDKTAASTVTEVCYEGDRLLMVRLRGKYADIVLIQVPQGRRNR